MQYCRGMDDLDRQIAAALQVNGRATWLQIARAVDSSESTVARRAQRLIEHGVLRIAAVTDPGRAGFGYPVLVQLKCGAAAPKVADILADRADARFLALVTGTFDIVMELIVPSRRYLANVLLNELTAIEGIAETTTESVVRNFKTSYDWSRDLLGEAADELEGSLGATADPDREATLDPIDLQLVQLLSEDGRRSFADLAAQLGISESVARRRVHSMCASGSMSFATFVAPELLGYDVELMCWMRVDLSRLDEIASTLATLPEVRYVSATSGYSDLICEIILRSQDDLYDFSTKTLAGLNGVHNVNFALELQTVKRAHLRMDGNDQNQGAPPPLGRPQRDDGRQST